MFLSLLLARPERLILAIKTTKGVDICMAIDLSGLC
jgi:hypothetical protein